MVLPLFLSGLFEFNRRFLKRHQPQHPLFWCQRQARSDKGRIQVFFVRFNHGIPGKRKASVLLLVLHDTCIFYKGKGKSQSSTSPFKDFLFSKKASAFFENKYFTVDFGQVSSILPPVSGNHLLWIQSLFCLFRSWSPLLQGPDSCFILPSLCDRCGLQTGWLLPGW